MKTIIWILLILLLSFIISAQDIGYAEYFLDTDPGYGKATKINIAAPASDLTLNFDLSTNALSNGWHFIGIRAKNIDGKWGLNCNRLLYLVKLPAIIDRKISKAEYFIDIDPGIGKASPFIVNSQDYELTLAATADLAALSAGMHNLGVRCSDLGGRWGVQTNRIFYYGKISAISAKICKAEYFIDTDPGFGKAKQFTIATPSLDLTLDITDNLAGLEQGIHQIVFRAADEKERWGISMTRVFYYSKISSMATKVSKAEYFIDTDPGFGKAKQFTIASPGSDLALDLTDDLAGMEQGMHQIGFRARDEDGRWGSAIQRIFYFLKIPNPDQANITHIEYFFDNDPGYGLGTSVAVPSPAQDKDIIINADVSALAQGNHIIYLRVKNAISQWGQLYAEAFTYTVTGLGKNEVVRLFKIYPNPNNGNFKIQFPENHSDIFKIRIIDLSGNTIIDKNVAGKCGEFSLDIPKGIYLINLESGHHVFSQKLCIE